MKLSIITINYNNASGLRKTLASVASQTYHNIEHIIIDGGSTDGSVDIIREYAEDQTPNIKHHTSHIVKWVSEPDKGIYNAMNKGIEIALGRRIVNSFNRSELVEDKNHGIEMALGRCVVNDDHTSHITQHTSNESLCDYVWILNSGDCVASTDVVERMMGVLDHSSHITHHTSNIKHQTSIPLLLGNIIHVYADGKRKAESRKCKECGIKPCPMNVSMLTFYSGTVPHDAAFVRRDLFEKFGYFDKKMKICADWKLYLDMIALEGIQPWHVDIDVVNFDMSGVSNTNNELRLAERRMYLEQVLPVSVLRDYDAYAAPIHQYQRLKKHHLWGLVYFVERILFKLEKWRVLRS